MKFFIVVIICLCSFVPSLSHAVTADYSFVPLQRDSVLSYHVYYVEPESRDSPVMVVLEPTVTDDGRIHCDIIGLKKDHKYLFTVVAVDKDDAKSIISNTLHFSTSSKAELSIMTMTQVDKFRARIKRID